MRVVFGECGRVIDGSADDGESQLPMSADLAEKTALDPNWRYRFFAGLLQIICCDKLV